MTCLCLDPQNLHNLTAEGAKNVDEADDDFDEDDDYEDDDDDSLIIEDLDEHLREEEDDDNDDRDDDKKEGELCEVQFVQLFRRSVLGFLTVVTMIKAVSIRN